MPEVTISGAYIAGLVLLLIGSALVLVGVWLADEPFQGRLREGRRWRR